MGGARPMLGGMRVGQPMIPPLLRIAIRNILRNRRRSLITFSALCLGLAILVSIRSFLSGLQATLRDEVVLSQTGALQVHRVGYLNSVSASLELDLPADDAFLAKITAVPGVKVASPRISFPGMANANDTTAFVVFTGIDPRREFEVCPRRAEFVSAGTTLEKAGDASAILSQDLARLIGVSLGERTTLLTNDRDGVLNAVDLSYVASYGQAHMPLPEKKFGFLPLAVAQDLLRMGPRATEVVISIDNLDHAEKLKPRVQTAVGPAYEVTSWRDVAAFVEDTIAIQNIVLNVLAGIFLAVALLGIANTMFMSVSERVREIGTMMALGVRRRQILTLFLLEATMIGLCGSLLGAAMGSCWVLYFGSRGMLLRAGMFDKPLRVYPILGPDYVVSVVAIAALGAVLAALLPSLRASRLRPVEALDSL